MWVINPPGTGGGGGTGTVTSVGTGFGLTGGTITGAGTIALDAANTNGFLQNTSGSLAFTGISTSGVLSGDGTSGNPITLAAGTVNGSGIAGQVTYWTGPSTLSGDPNFLWDRTNFNFGVGDFGGASQSAKLTIDNTNKIITMSIAGNWPQVLKLDSGGGANTVLGASGGNLTQLTIFDGTGSFTLGTQSGLRILGSDSTGLFAIQKGSSQTLRSDMGAANLRIGDLTGTGAFFNANLPVGSHGLSTLYINSRNDTASSTPINFLYTNTSGVLLSAPLASIGGGTVTSVATGAGLSGGPITGAGTIVASANTLTATFGITANGQGATVSTGLLNYLVIPYNCTIISWSIVSNQSGSIVYDIWKLNNAIPTITNTIVASAPPTLTTAQLASSSTLTGWTTSVVAGDVIAFNVNSATSVQNVTLEIKVLKP